MRKLVIFGLKNLAEIVHYYFTHDSDWTTVAFTVDAAYLRESTFQGLPVVPFEEVEQHYPPQEYSMFVAIGIGQLNTQRAAKVAQAQAKGYRLASFVSSRAICPPELHVGPNTMIMEKAHVMPFVTIGPDTVIWNGTILGFHSRIGAHCWLTAPILGETVTVGDYTFIGLNATVAPYVSVGKNNIIGAGALIMKDTKDDEVYAGHVSTPAKVLSHELWKFGGFNW